MGVRHGTTGDEVFAAKFGDRKFGPESLSTLIYHKILYLFWGIDKISIISQ